MRASWAAENADTLGADADSLTVMGDSAGGNLSAVVCLMARELSRPSISRQVLIYPATDGTLKQPSIVRLGDAPILNKKMIDFFNGQYARSAEDTQAGYFSPLLADDLSGLPPALVITAQYDPMRDDGLAYARRLREAGNYVQSTDYPGMVHGFLSFPPICGCPEKAFEEIAGFVKQAGLE